MGIFDNLPMPLIAGSNTGRVIDRFSELQSCPFVFACANEHTEAWWSDVAFALRIGKRVITAGEYDQSDELRLAGLAASDCSIWDCPKDDALLLARFAVANDPRGTWRGTTWGTALLGFLRQCESPIEARLLLHLFPEISVDTCCDVNPQREVLDGRYRIDLAVLYEPRADLVALDFPDHAIRIAVEADGHDYHERTKEQARRDKSRDRELTIAGWSVLRFTGSEIWSDPGKCATSIFDLVSANGGAFR